VCLIRVNRQLNRIDRAEAVIGWLACGRWRTANRWGAALLARSDGCRVRSAREGTEGRGVGGDVRTGPHRLRGAVRPGSAQGLSWSQHLRRAW